MRSEGGGLLLLASRFSACLQSVYIGIEHNIYIYNVR